MDDPLMQPKQTAPPGGLFASPSSAPSPTPGDGNSSPPSNGVRTPAAGDTGPKPGTDAWKFLFVLLRMGGRAAIWQVAAELRRPDHAISQRPSEMVARGWIRRTGEYNRRPMSDKRCEIFEALVDLDGRPLTTTPTTASPQ